MAKSLICQIFNCEEMKEPDKTTFTKYKPEKKVE